MKPKIQLRTLNGCQSSDTFSELRLEFSTKELAINYAKMKIDYDIIEPKKKD